MILNETQLERDMELSQILGIPVEEVESKVIKSPDAIRIFDGKIPPDDYTSLYKSFRCLDWVAYLRTLMFTSVKCRGKRLIRLLQTTRDSVCLDFGCGVGTHTIALLENGNSVDILDVNGPLLDFAKKRIEKRNLGTNCSVYYNTQTLPEEYYDLVICTNVLEHVVDPIYELKRITQAIRVQGMLHLVVSSMVKSSSGHFAKTINCWKKEGPIFLKRYYIEVEPSLFRKKL